MLQQAGSHGFAFFVLVVVRLAGVASGAVSVEGVLSLDQRNFDDVVRKYDRVFIQWYAPWCDKCKRLWPEFTEVSKKIQGFSLETKLAMVDATEETTLAGKYNIAGPVLDYYVGGEKFESYDAGQTADDIWGFLKQRESPTVTEVQPDKLNEFLSSATPAEFVLVAHVKKKSVRHKAFLQSLGAITDLLGDAIQYVVSRLPKDADPKKDAKLYMQRSKFVSPEDPFVAFTGSWSKIDISLWAKKSSFPLVGTTFAVKYAPEVVESFGWEGVVVLCGEDDDEEDDDENEWVSSLADMARPVASTYPRLKFTICDASTLSKKDKEALLGDASGSSGHAFVSLRLAGKRRYVMDGPQPLQDAGSLAKFLSDAKAGKIPGRYKSGPNPASEVDSHGVVTLTGKTFEKYVKDSKRDVFVEFTHPRCDHCKQLAPVWQNLAKEVRRKGWSKKGVVIARMDMEANDCEEEVSEYPKLVLYPAVKPDRKMKQKIIFKPDKVQSLADFPLERFTGFLSNSALTIEGEEEREIEAELAKSRSKMRGKSKPEL